MEKNTNTQLRFLLSNSESLALMEAASFFVLNLFQDKKDIADSRKELQKTIINQKMNSLINTKIKKTNYEY
jgi:hypothetical protein